MAAVKLVDMKVQDLIAQGGRPRTLRVPRACETSALHARLAIPMAWHCPPSQPEHMSAIQRCGQRISLRTQTRHASVAIARQSATHALLES